MLRLEVCLVLVVLNIRVPLQGSYGERALQSEMIKKKKKKIDCNDDREQNIVELLTL
jgi:hypothetical protein